MRRHWSEAPHTATYRSINRRSSFFACSCCTSLTSFMAEAPHNCEAASWLQAGDLRVQVAAWSNTIVPGRWLPADCRLRMPPAPLSWCQRAQCSEDTQSTRRQEFLSRGSKSLEQSACSAATARRRIRTVQATFKVISFWRDRGAFVTFSCFSMRRV